MTLLAKYTIKLAGRSAAKSFENATRDVASTQRAKLREIMERNAETEFGRAHGFGTVRTLEEYRDAVPVQHYEDMREAVDRMAAGEQGILTAEPPLMFAQTSGTTGKPKLIPVTASCRGREHEIPMRTWLYHAQQDHPGIFSGKVLSLVSPAVEGHTKAGIPFGSTSGFIYKNLPGPIQKTYLVPYELFELDDYEAKYYALMRLGLTGNVTFLCTANPSSIAKLCEVVDERAEELIRDVRDGGVGEHVELPEELRRKLRAQLPPAPERARELERMRAGRDGRLLPADFWPDLELIGCWKGGTVGSYIERFGQWFDPDERRPVPVRDWGYLSSEARGSVPLTDEGCGGVLTVGSNVIEFVPVEDVDEHPEEPERWTFLGAHEVESPCEYLVFFTTTGGLYRYDINDVVLVEDFHNEAPIVTFQRKGRGMTSLTGEKLSVNQVIDAITAAADACSREVTHFRAVADVEEARYYFYVECDGELGEEDCRQLLGHIEENLAETNLEYASKRKSQRLAPPRLRLMKAGWYDEGKRQQGARLFQSKTVVLEPRDKGESDSIERRSCLREVEL